MTAATTTSSVVEVLARCWARLVREHPEIPPCVIVIGTQSRHRAHGWHWSGRWAVQAGEPRTEIAIAGEHLADGPHAVLGTLIHEAAHALAVGRKVKDTSRGGRWHNRRFSALASELGLIVVTCKQIGHRTRGLTDEAAATWRFELLELMDAMRRSDHARRIPPGTPTGGTGTGGTGTGGTGTGGTGTGGKPTNPAPLLCSCVPARRIRVAPTVAARGPIICSICLQCFGGAA
jgi:hypothetical protein